MDGPAPPDSSVEPPAASAGQGAPWLESLRRAYGLGDSARAELLRPDAWSISASDGSRYVMRRFRGRAAADFETGLWAYLRRACLPAPDLIPTGFGAPYVRQDGECFGLTYEAGGYGFDRGDPRHVEAAAVVLARYHRLALEYAGPLRLACLPYPPAAAGGLRARVASALALIGPHLQTAEYLRLERLLAGIDCELAKCHEVLAEVYARTPRILIHGNFGPEALSFDGSGRAVRLDDFSRASLDVASVDVAGAISRLCVRDGPLDAQAPRRLAGERVRLFLDAYLGERHPGAEAGGTLPAFLAIAWLAEALRGLGAALESRAADPSLLVRAIDDAGQRAAGLKAYLEALDGFNS